MFGSYHYKLANEALKSPTIMTHLYDSINNIANIVSTIHRTKGQDWAKHVVGGDGRQVFSEKEQETVSTLFNPFVSDIVTFFGHGTQEGGEQRPDIIKALSELHTIKKDLGISKEPEPEEEEQPTTMFGLDELYIKFLNSIEGINNSVKKFAGDSGILKFEKESDEQEDWRIVPDLITSKMKTVPNPMIYNTGVFLEKLRLPLRTIVMIIYLFLDIARISAGVAGKIERRNILSTVVALIDLLRGDWKKAIFSYMGVFGEKPLIRGEFLKIFLTGFQMLSPELQDTFTYGAFDAGKSFLVGLLLMVFRATANDSVRLPLVISLYKLRIAKEALDKSLTSQPNPLKTHGGSCDAPPDDSTLPPRPDYLSPSWEDLNNLQALMSDPDFVCSTDYYELLQTAGVIKSSASIAVPVPSAPPEEQLSAAYAAAAVAAVRMKGEDNTNSQPGSPLKSGTPPESGTPEPGTALNQPGSPTPEPILVTPNPVTPNSVTPVPPIIKSPPVKDNIIPLVLQILRIPLSEEFRKYKCGEGLPTRSFVDIVAARSLKTVQETQEKHRIAGKPNMQLPVAADTTTTVPPSAPVKGGAKKTPRSKRTPRRSVKH